MDREVAMAVAVSRSRSVAAGTARARVRFAEDADFGGERPLTKRISDALTNTLMRWLIACNDTECCVLPDEHRRPRATSVT